MRIFVAGGTGAIGRPLTAQLIEAGFEPVIFTRNEATARELNARGIGAYVGDALDEAVVASAVARSKPDAIVNELTNIPPKTDPRAAAEQFATTNALRKHGTANLVRAAERYGVAQVISQSVAFYYAPGPGPAAETNDLVTPTFSPLTEILAAIRACETLTLENPAFRGVVLRYGSLYGPGTQYATGGQYDELVKQRGFPVVGAGDGGMSFTHVDDAARAVVDALRGGPAGIYNIVDDDPARMREFIATYARRHGAPKPPRVPGWLAQLRIGRFGVYFMTRLRAASNAKAKAGLRFEPRYPTWRTAI